MKKHFRAKEFSLAVCSLLICLFLIMIVSCGKKKPTDSDGQTRWVAANDGLGSLLVQFLAVHPANSDIIFVGTWDGLYKSIDGAQSWARVDSGWSHTQVSGVAFDPLDDDVVYAGINGAGVFKSEDGGDKWKPRNSGLGNAVVYSIATDPLHSDTLLVGCEGGIYLSHDGADHWSFVNGLPRAFVDIDPQDPQNIYAGGKWNNFHKSENAGSTWVKSSEGITPGGPDRRIQWVLIDPVDPEIIYVGSNNIGVFKSTNRGADWNEKNTGISGTVNVRSIALDLFDRDHLYAASDNGVWRSTDGAETWGQMNEGLNGLDVRALATDPLRPGIFYAGTWGGGVFIWK